MTKEENIDFLKKKFAEFHKATFVKFSEILKVHQREKPTINAVNSRLIEKKIGAYVVYKGSKAIYVGSAGKGDSNLRIRVGDLFLYNPKANLERNRTYHTLAHKYLVEPEEKNRKYRTQDEWRRFLGKNCRVKTVQTDYLVDAKLLEMALIRQLEPDYNDEIIEKRKNDT